MKYLATALALVLLAALGVGAAVRSGGNHSGVSGHPAVLAQGSFHAVTWGTRGTASIARDVSGKLTLRFDKHFVTEDAPLLYVYVAGYTRNHRNDWKLAGMLQRASGSQEFTLPSGMVRGRRADVMIFCGKCDKIWGEAELAPVPARSV